MANCSICGNIADKYSLSGLNGNICANCQKNVSNIRKGYVTEARRYFNNISIQSVAAKNFIDNQYIEYADAAIENAAAAEEYSKECARIEALKQNTENMIITTTPTLDGYRIIKYIDVIYAEAIYKVNLGKSLINSINNAFDAWNIFSSTDLSGTSSIIEEAKDYVKKSLITKAASLGANAIVGIDIESSVANDGAAKASINGTAVVVEKISPSK